MRDKGCIRRFIDASYCHSVLNPPYSLGLAVFVVCSFFLQEGGVIGG